MPSTTKFEPSVWSTTRQREYIARNMQRALWALENDLSPSLIVRYSGEQGGWDTHFENTRQQSIWNGTRRVRSHS